MITPKLFFGINLDFNLTLNDVLKNLSVLKIWDRGLQKYLYIFPIDKLNEVTALIKEPIKFEPVDISKIIYYSKMDSQEIEMESWKGKSGYEILEFPRIYQVISYQKPKGGKPQRQVNVVNKETLLRVWKVFQNMEKDKFYDFEYIAEHISREFNLKRFFRPTSNSFDKEKFQGTRCPHEYGTFYYFPIVVMEWLGLIERKGRFSKRIKDKFEEQVRINKKVE